MGDQIKRYCEKLEHEEYEELRDNEVIFYSSLNVKHKDKTLLLQANVANELVDYDPNCIQTKDRGREVFVCK